MSFFGFNVFNKGILIFFRNIKARHVRKNFIRTLSRMNFILLFEDVLTPLHTLPAIMFNVIFDTKRIVRTINRAAIVITHADNPFTAFGFIKICMHNWTINHGATICSRKNKTYFTNSAMHHIICPLLKLIGKYTETTNISSINIELSKLTLRRSIKISIPINAIITRFKIHMA